MNSAEIQQAFNAEVGRITDGLAAVREGLRSVVADGEQPADVIEDALHAAFDEADGEYAAAVEERNRKLVERAAELRANLFAAPSGAAGPAFTNALTQAANADEDQLRTLAELAAKTGDSTLGKAIFAVATERGLADIALPYLNANPEAREAFRELGSLPTTEERELGADFRFPRPSLGDLRPTAHEILEAERMERVRRAQHAAWAANSW